MDWLFTSLRWYLVLFTIGIIFFPYARRFFPNFIDQGYVFGKTIGILLLSYSALILGVAKIAPFTQVELYGLLGLFAIGSFVILRMKFEGPLANARSSNRLRDSSTSPQNDNKKLLLVIVFEELLFLCSFLFLVFIRGQEPSIHSLEKYMDFGFMQSILRAKYFPPLDMWLSADPTHPAGYPINYYYFGHLTGALLIRLTGISSTIGYNLILATIFGQGITLTFSLVASMVKVLKRVGEFTLVLYGLLGTFIVNLGGNLHTIYLFTSGYAVDSPKPFWQIFSYEATKKLAQCAFNSLTFTQSATCQTSYWYPNATRFIPFTIHEFPSYSYVVADLHGHVFDIPFVLLTLALLFVFFVKASTNQGQGPRAKGQNFIEILRIILHSKFLILNSILFGFMAAVHYMTNAFDGPIYMLLAIVVFFTLYGLSLQTFISIGLVGISFYLFSLPFRMHFIPFVSGVGVNCSPSFLVKIAKLGPFLFEKDKCQPSPLWMLFVLWGFFLINFVIFLTTKYLKGEDKKPNPVVKFLFILFAFSTTLLIIPEFFYIKDIYPAHFRANTMFKLGYQAFIMMGIASTITVAYFMDLRSRARHIFKGIFLIIFFLIFLYPFYAFPSYYGDLKKVPQLDGSIWLNTDHPEDKEVINYLNTHIIGQPVVLEAQGDSYTDYERISAFTGLPTVAGWWVHEWLWRGSSDVVGKRIPEVTSLYESQDEDATEKLIKKYSIKYIVVGPLEKEKYKNLYENKFYTVGTRIFESSSQLGALYRAK